MNQNVLRYTGIAVLSVVIGLLLVSTGFLARMIVEPAAEPEPEPVAGSDIEPHDFDLLAEIAQVIEQDYVEPDRVNADVLRDGAIEGIFRALNDPHSTYIDPDTYALSRDDFEGSFQGIGATVTSEGEWVVITQPLPDTPAEAAGIEAGTVILEVDGESAEGWSVEEAVLHIRGPEGSEVTLTVRFPDGTEEALTIERASIPVHSVLDIPPRGDFVDENGDPVEDLAYIRIGSFTRGTPDEFVEAVAEAEASGAQGIVLDIRSNSGGLLQETLLIADMLLDGGTLVAQVDQSGVESVVEADEEQITKLPIVVLQDEFSASGSELLAAALKDNGRASIVGTRSFGKGTVNHVRELSNGGAVYVSIARWLTPERNQIEGRGIAPDVEVESTLEDIEANRDVALYEAIETLRSEVVVAS